MSTQKTVPRSLVSFLSERSTNVCPSEDQACRKTGYEVPVYGYLPERRSRVSKGKVVRDISYVCHAACRKTGSSKVGACILRVVVSIRTYIYFKLML